MNESNHPVRNVVRKEAVMRYRKVLWFLLFIAVRAISADELSQSVEMTFTVNIEPPVCKLNNADLSVNFGEFDTSDIVKGNVKGTAVFSFTDCTNVNNVGISFSGDNMDSTNNFIKNKSGDGYASGVAIVLYDDTGRRIQLTDSKMIAVNNDTTSFNFSVTAEVQKESNTSTVYPGNIETSVNLNITYS
ncbi:TPA: fimbrial protein [Escherichia coli]|nr:fimbrial protein [Escherichia coli]MED9059727.1 fimbrial protein [Escherichia coli]MED9074155.1 fimbrial protein [Escherichia coli]MED9096918.1 fimbrial protein [Escherichia coli]